MPELSTFQPDWASSPGETIADILDERGLTLAEFARKIDESPKEVKNLLEGRAEITIAFARKLAIALGGSVEFWIARDFRYREQLAKPTTSPTRDHAWLKQLPLSDMIKFGWVKRDADQLRACLSFFDTPNVAAWHRAYTSIEQRFAFRTSAAFDSNPAAVAAWLRQGEIEATKLRCAPWSAARFQAALEEIRILTRESDPQVFVPKLQRICAEAGVAVVVLRAPTGCRASGATCFVTPDRALLLLSFRFLSDDQFWFSFFHEAGHLLLHSHKEVFLEGIEATEADFEKEANDFAANVLIPPQHKPELMRLRANKFDLARFAKRMGVSPGIVVGQLQHNRRIKPSHFNALKRRYTWE